jgi:hypothetical protein
MMMQVKMESTSSQSVDDDELTRPLKDSLAATLLKLKRKVLASRAVDVTVCGSCYC